jgi:lysophospholipase L1-like esterase
MTARQAIPTTASSQDWQNLSQLKIAFGHQSVGGNVIAGIEALAHENDVALSVAESRDAFAAPGLHHFKIGRNGEPRSKIEDFDATMSHKIAGTADIALMKLCYTDFDSEANPQQLARDYIAEVDQLASRFPQTTFVPVTAPLTAVQTGPKALIKKLLGKEPAGYDSNARRKLFNETLRQHYANRDLLFDIAAIESDFGKVIIERDGQPIEALNPDITSDGGHLNDQGQHLIGGALVHHLANVARPHSAE